MRKFPCYFNVLAGSFHLALLLEMRSKLWLTAVPYCFLRCLSIALLGDFTSVCARWLLTPWHGSCLGHLKVSVSSSYWQILFVFWLIFSFYSWQVPIQVSKDWPVATLGCECLNFLKLFQKTQWGIRVHLDICWIWRSLDRLLKVTGSALALRWPTVWAWLRQCSDFLYLTKRCNASLSPKAQARSHWKQEKEDPWFLFSFKHPLSQGEPKTWYQSLLLGCILD